MTTTIADMLQKVLNTKDSFKSLIEENGATAPTLFSDYASTLDNIMQSMRNQLKSADKVVINKDTSLENLNSFFEFLPSVGAGSTTTTQAKIEVTAANLNVRSGGSGSDSYVGLLTQGDIVDVYGTASSGWYKINQWREGGVGSSLVTHSNSYGYVSNNSSYVTYIPGSTTSTSRKIDISACNGANVQNKCNYVLAKSKGWEVVFGSGYGPSGSSGSTVTTTENTVEYSFNNYFTDQYKNSSYSSYSNTMANELRQGYWSGYYYYKGNFRFTNSRLAEVKNLLNHSTIKSVQIYVQRASSAHGTSSAATLKLYACDSTGANADVLVDGSSTLTRGSGKWITLNSTVINGFKTGKYDHFKAYHPSTSVSYYMVFAMNAKLKITYTA